MKRTFLIPVMVVFALMLLTPAGAAHAQGCAADTEPNDQPEQATPAAPGCVEGALQAGDQDFFAFTFDQAAAAQPWDLAAVGPAGQVATVQLFLLPPDGGAPVLLNRLDLPAGSQGALTDLILLPGAYAVGVSASGEGTYRLEWQPGAPLPPGGDVEPNDDAYSTPTPVTGAFALSGDLQGSADTYKWTVSATDAQQGWRLSLRGPLGQKIYLNVAGPSGWPGIYGSSATGGSIDIYALGLPAGDYEISLTPAQAGSTPYALAAQPVGPRAPDQEEEPNDRFDLAYVLDPALGMAGSLQLPGDTDYYRFTVDAGFAARQWSLAAVSEQPADLYLCILDSAGVELQCREGEEPELVDLVLQPGVYGIALRDRNHQANRYSLRFKQTGDASPDFEAEPNDLVSWASPLNADNALRGRTVGRDGDYLRLTVSGPPQLWRVQVAGEGLERLEYVDITGNAQMSRQAEGGRRIRLENLYLQPGDHYLRVVGQDGKYTVRAIALGAPAAAPVPAEQQTAGGTTDAEAGPPPIPVTEREPNDLPELAMRVELDTAQSGRLSEGDERDVYRFYLPATALVRFTVLPPADAAVDLSVDNLLGRGNAGAGQPFVYTAVLPAGDHLATLTPNPLSDQPYQLLIERQNWFAPPIDLEPGNNWPESAATLTATGVVTGQLDAGDLADFYRLPEPLPAAANPITVTLGGALWGVDIYSGTERLDVLTRQPDGVTFTGIVSGGPLALRVTGAGVYTFGVELAGLDAAALPPPSIAIGAAPATPIAAYWTTGQRLDWALSLTNTAAAAQTVTLDFHVNDGRWQVLPVVQPITVAPGAAATVPLSLAVLYDAPPGTVTVDVRARDAAGAAQIASFQFLSACGVAPVAPDPALTTAGPLLGGLNVAWSGLGGQALGEDPARLAPLFDGIVAPGTGYRGDLGAAVTVAFTTTQPVPIAGVLLDPFGSTPAPDTVRNFVVATSLDGIVYTPVYTGAADLLAMEQPFVFDQPTPARFARLTLLDSHNQNYPAGVGLGEFKVIAAPGADVSDGKPFNLADPAVGGHVVMVTPLLNDPQLMLTDDQKRPQLYVQDGTAPITWTLAFRDNRAAQIVALQWQNAGEGDPAQRMGSVDVAASMDSLLGPWTPLGAWTLDPAAPGVQQFDLPAPQWVRYLQFSVRNPGAASTVEFPDVLRVIERNQDAGYTSALAEYGEYRQAAGYELQRTPAATAAIAAGDNLSRDTALPLVLGAAVHGAVEAGVNSNWYRIEVPEGANMLTVSLAGDSALGVAAELSDAAGAPAPVASSVAGNTLLLEAAVTPGAYYLQVMEPPRAVVFAWDTSGSVGPYTNIIYRALATFTAAVDPQLEVINLLPFGEPGQFLLPEWSSDAGAIQAALSRYPRLDGSSNAELNLLTATEALGQRTGQRAVLLITDAESNGYDKTPALWDALARVHPRVFSFEISSGGIAASQDLMQDWAAASGGQYAHVTTIGDMEVGFDRAACLLRRPAGYTIVASVTAAPPVPTFSGTGALAVSAASDTGAVGGPVAAPAPGAFEVILDASGSMLQRIDGRAKIDIARGVLVDLVNNKLPPGTPLALRVFGNREADSCRTDLELPLQPLDPAVATGVLNGVDAINLARTPIADSLAAVAEDLAAASGPRAVVLVTDGEETCGGDPAQVIRDLRAQGYDVRVNIVGFDVADPTLQATFQAWAALGGGFYFNAANADELGSAMTQAVQPGFRVRGGDGAIVVAGVVGGEPVSVPAGIYTVEVDGEPPVRFEQVVVDGDQTVELTMPAAP